MIIDARCPLGEGFRFSQSAEALLLEMDKNNVEKLPERMVFRVSKYLRYTKF